MDPPRPPFFWRYEIGSIYVDHIHHAGYIKREQVFLQGRGGSALGFFKTNLRAIEEAIVEQQLLLQRQPIPVSATILWISSILARYTHAVASVLCLGIVVSQLLVTPAEDADYQYDPPNILPALSTHALLW